MYFPPAFFNIMVHLIVHLVREIKCCGPIYLQWMYPIERYMKILKGYIKNIHCLEASIVEGYIAKKLLNFVHSTLKRKNLLGFPSLVMMKE